MLTWSLNARNAVIRMETFVTSHQTVSRAAVMWWFRPPPLLLPSCWKECHYIWPTRHQLGCSHDHMLQSSSLIVRQDIMYIHRDHQTWNITVCTHTPPVCEQDCRNCGSCCCVRWRAFSLVFKSLLVATCCFLPSRMNFPLLY